MVAFLIIKPIVIYAYIFQFNYAFSNSSRSIDTMTTTTLTWPEMQQAMADGRLSITTGKDISKGTIPHNNIHHAHALTRPDGASLENFNFVFPVLKGSNITKQIIPPSTSASFFLFLDIYGNWPKGKIRGEDPKGDAVFDFLLAIEASYQASLEKDNETRMEIFKYAAQEPIVRNEKQTITNIEKVINPIICYSTFPVGHAQEGLRDDSKSPNFRVKLWDVKLTDKNRDKIRNDSLLVNVDPNADPNGDPNDPNRYLQRIFTQIFDLRRNKMSDTYITREHALNEFIYAKGDSSQGKSQFTMLVVATVLAPSWYWEAKKVGASLQFKASAIDIYQKTFLRRTNARTTETKIIRHQEALAAMREYGLDQNDDENDDGGNSSGSDEHNRHQQQQQGNGDTNGHPPPYRTSTTQTSTTQRHVNTNAVVSTRPRTIPVNVYPADYAARGNGAPSPALVRGGSPSFNDNNNNNNNNNNNGGGADDQSSEEEPPPRGTPPNEENEGEGTNDFRSNPIDSVTIPTFTQEEEDYMNQDNSRGYKRTQQQYQQQQPQRTHHQSKRRRTEKGK